MTPEGVRRLMVFYICPRPVVLVSVAGEHHNNLFPMDLIGAVSEDRFTLALRSTNPSILTMRTTRRVAISDMPASLTPVIYRLGGHHKKSNVDWSELPFGMKKSSLFSLPHPSNALRVRELEILSCTEVGSHTLFVTRMASDIRYSEGPQLFHVSGDYQHYRAKIATPFALAG
jgi:flavin reductase (DIM6/NTAB) family NADH-FMN oxidoreductase RutF